MDRKALDKHKNAAKGFCQQLGQYRMPLAWTAINVVDIITGTKSAGQGEAVPIPPEKGTFSCIESALYCTIFYINIMILYCVLKNVHNPFHLPLVGIVGQL